MASTIVDQFDEPLLTALIVDDSRFDRARLKRLCLRSGMKVEVVEAATLAEMRAAMDKTEFDLVFLDYNLGLDTGLDALRLVLAHPDQEQAIPIMVTCIARHDVVVEAMRRGCADYLVKEELSEDQLRKSVTTAIERRVLLAALMDARTFRNSVERTITRFSRTCGPEMRAIISSMLRTLRSLQRQDAIDPVLRPELTMLERGAKDIVVFLDELVSLVDGALDEAHRSDDAGKNRN
ncbi:response regulator [Cognatishimia sp. F0-27]|nr:response regulator [Cognatishimia sp. F0-27]